MPTRNVVLSEPQANLVRELVDSGRYQNASEVIRAGLRLLEDHEAALQEVRAGLLEGLAQAADGKALDGKAAIEQTFAKALAKSRK